MKKNKSIIQTDSEYCYIHREFLGIDVPAVHLHHMFHGTSRRKIADEDGCYCFLCMQCHAALHDRGLYDLKLQQIAEKAWLEKYQKTVDDFIKRYGKSYLE